MSDVEFGAEVRKSAISNFIFNTAINGGLTLWLMSGSEVLSMWAEPAFGPDFIATGFILSVILSAIVVELHRRKAMNGEMAPVPITSSTLQRISTQNRWVGCGAFGVAGALVSVVALGVISLLADSMSLETYAVVKGLWTGTLAAAIVLPAMLLGLHLGAKQAASA